MVRRTCWFHCPCTWKWLFPDKTTCSHCSPVPFQYCFSRLIFSSSWLQSQLFFTWRQPFMPVVFSKLWKKKCKLQLQINQWWDYCWFSFFPYPVLQDNFIGCSRQIFTGTRLKTLDFTIQIFVPIIVVFHKRAGIPARFIYNKWQGYDYTGGTRNLHCWNFKIFWKNVSN